MENNTYQIFDSKTGLAVSGVYSYAQRNRARNKANKLDMAYGAVRYTVRVTFA